MHYTDCVGTCKTTYFGYPEDVSLVLKHVEILYVMCERQSFVPIYWLL
jgi:hypothetical protein